MGHLERFERKLPKSSRKRLYWRIGWMVAAVAASLLLLLFLRPQLQTDEAEGNDLSGLASEEVRGEIRDLCQYYQMRVNGILAQMEGDFHWEVMAPSENGRTQIRLVTSWATREEAVEAFLERLGQLSR